MADEVIVKPRYHLIDALRGLSIILMVGYHLGIQLIDFMGAPEALVYNPLLDILQPIFGGLFILLSGMSCRFSKSNLKRGALTLGCAYGVSVVMYLFGYPVWFGILHMLGCAMLIYGVAEKWLERLPFQPLAYLLLFAVSYIFLPTEIDEPTALFMPLGFYNDYGNDYFPLAPWLFLFLFGTWLGRLAVEEKLPKWFYRFDMPVLPFIGRHTLFIYLAHQPIIYVALELINALR